MTKQHAMAMPSQSRLFDGDSGYVSASVREPMKAMVKEAASESLMTEKAKWATSGFVATSATVASTRMTDVRRSARKTPRPLPRAVANSAVDAATALHWTA